MSGKTLSRTEKIAVAFILNAKRLLMIVPFLLIISYLLIIWTTDEHFGISIFHTAGIFMGDSYSNIEGLKEPNLPLEWITVIILVFLRIYGWLFIPILAAIVLEIGYEELALLIRIRKDPPETLKEQDMNGNGA